MNAEPIAEPLGIVCALPSEAALFGVRERNRDVIRVDSRLLCVIAGAGICNAANAATRLMDKGARTLISWGFAGSLSADLRPGHLVLPRTVREFHHQNGRAWDVDPLLWQRLCELAKPELTVFTGELLCARDIVRSVASKQALYDVCGHAAVDMESAGVMRAARDAAIPAMVVRAIVDAASVSIPDYIDAEVPTGVILRAALGRPSTIPSMMSLAAGYRKATASLKRMARKLRQ